MSPPPTSPALSPPQASGSGGGDDSGGGGGDSTLLIVVIIGLLLLFIVIGGAFIFVAKVKKFKDGAVRENVSFDNPMYAAAGSSADNSTNDSNSFNRTSAAYADPSTFSNAGRDNGDMDVPAGGTAGTGYMDVAPSSPVDGDGDGDDEEEDV